MNKIILMGRLTRDPEIRYGGANNTCVASFSLAVDRRFKREGQADADFFRCVAFGKTGEFAEKYLKKGTKVVIDGEMRNNNYESRKHPGETVYDFQVVINSIEFAESKKAQAENAADVQQAPSDPKEQSDDFVNIPDNIDTDLPFV